MTQLTTIRSSIKVVSVFIVLLWILKLVEFFTGIDLPSHGVLPRKESGLVGVMFGPLIHGSWQHLIANTPPLALLGVMLVYGYPKSRFWAFAGIWLLSGICVWIFARSSYHFGASGLTHGIFFYLFVGGILRRDRRSAAILMIAFYMYGGMLLTIFPREPGISFESHFFGAAAGVLCAFLFRHWDPKPERLRYPWQRNPGEPEAEEDDPVIGDQWKLDQEEPPERKE